MAEGVKSLRIMEGESYGSRSYGMSDCRLEEGVGAVTTGLDGVDMFGASCLRFRIFVAVEVVEADES